VLRVAMPRGARLYAPGATVHVVARCNNREFYFTTREDFAVLLAHLRELVRTYEVTLYAYTLMSNYVHLLLQAPKADAPCRPFR
jgi:REP element-mobilizing transposase RayT